MVVSDPLHLVVTVFNLLFTGVDIEKLQTVYDFHAYPLQAKLKHVLIRYLPI